MSKKNKKIKGLKRVNKIINEFCDQFGVTARPAAEFIAILEDREITYSFVVTDPADKYFIPFINKLAPDITADIFLVSLFHEIGHLYTQFNFSEETWNRGWETKEAISKAIELCEERDEALIEMKNNEYFNLPEEKAATLWGINYIRTHEQEVAEFWAELQPALMRMFRKNGLI